MKKGKPPIGPITWEMIEEEMEGSPLVTETIKDREPAYGITLAGFYAASSILDDSGFLRMKHIDIDEAVKAIMLGNDVPSTGLWRAMSNFSSGCEQYLKTKAKELAGKEPEGELASNICLIALAQLQAEHWAKACQQ